MKRVFALSLVGLVDFTAPSYAGTEPTTAEGVCRPHVEAILSDGHGLVPGGLAPVRQAVHQELRRLGVEVTWVEKEYPEAVSSPLRVVFLPHTATGWGRSGETIGAVVLDGASTSSVYIFYPATKEVLGDPSDGGSILGRPSGHDWFKGLARVILHEMIHFLLPGRPHDAAGLFAPNLKATRLLGPNLELDPETHSALVSRLCPSGSRGLRR
jgi:hypothetical protein